MASAGLKLTMRSFYLLLFCLAVGAVAAPASATSQADKDACTPDVWRLCAGQIPNVDQIVACLNRKMGRLSPECRVVMQGGSDRGQRKSRRAD